MNAGPVQLGLLGYPLSHTFSPRLHTAALRALGLEGKYALYEIPPLPAGEKGLLDLLARLRQGEILGINVTIPHKQSVLPMMDELTPLAQNIGAVNTIRVDQSRLTGDNTDAPAFLADLRHLPHSGPRTALLLGAGGAARAVGHALLQDGWQVTIAARRLEQAQALIVDLAPAGKESLQGNAQTSALRLDLKNLRSSTPGLIVNTTPVGMAPHAGSSPWPEGLPLPPGCSVYDLVYNPQETKLMQQARAAGCPTRNGLGMLIEQAALALELWTGQAVPRAAMWRAI